MTVQSRVILSLALLLPFPASAQEGVMPKSAWLAGISSPKGLAWSLCQADQPFGRCLSVPTKACEEAATAALRSCIQRADPRIPTLMVLADAKSWGAWFAGCTFLAIEKTNPKSVSTTAVCKSDIEATKKHCASHGCL